MGEAISCLEHQLVALGGLRRVAERQIEKAPPTSDVAKAANADAAQLEERMRDVAEALSILGVKREPR